MDSTPNDLEDLQRRYRSGWRPKFLFFWGHTPKRAGILGAECLSQWFPAPFRVEGTAFPTAEHFMMWSKGNLFGDAETAQAVLAAGSPASAKQLGRQVRGFVEATWVVHRRQIVVRASVEKFSQNPELGSFLAQTGTKLLVEASPTDRIWGIGLSASDQGAENPLQWQGLNLLGFALMEARAKLAHSASP